MCEVTMSRGVNNFTSVPGDWWTEHEYHTYVGNNNDWRNQMMPVLSRHVPHQATLDGNRDDQGWQLVEERVMMLPLRFAGYSLPPHPARQLVLDSGAARGYPQGFTGQNYSPQGFTSQQNFPTLTSTQEEESRLSPDEQNMALKKLKKEMYNPAPKTFTSRLSLYYRDRSLDTSKERRKGTDEEGKRCAVCLEDFEPKEWVMLTPCSHMFHEECIVPWVKSKGQCPVCRSAFYERTRPIDLSEGDLLSVIRATEEVLRGNAAHW